MQSKKEQEKLGREKLQRIIDTCKTVEEHSLDPFLVNVDDGISTLKQHFPDWNIPEDLCLDAETIHHIASVIKLQSEWVKNRSTSLYSDPFLLEDKIRRMQKAEITEAFTKAWRPTIELEQITLHSLAEAIRYWDALPPISERWKETPAAELNSGTATREELIKQRVLRDKAFSEEMEIFWRSLLDRVEKEGTKGKIAYWDFVGADTYEETTQRAFMVSFLVTYGYATLEIHPLEEEMFIVPFRKPAKRLRTKQLISIPIRISIEDWRRWKKGEAT